MWFYNLAEQAAPELVGPEQEAWLERLEADHQNLRAALAWALARREAETALRLGTALWLFWHIRGHLAEGRSWLERATAHGAGAPPAVLAKALHRLGNLVVSMGDYADARTSYAASLDLARDLGDPRAIADALSGLGLARADQGDRAGARPLHEEALALRQAARGQAGVAISLSNLGDIAAAEGDVATARDRYEQVRAVWEELGDANGAAFAMTKLGRTARYENDLDTAEALCGQSLAQFLAMGDRAGQAFATHDLAWIAHRRGDDGLAVARFGDELALCRDIHDKPGLIEAVEGLATLAAHQRLHRSAARLLAAAAAARRALGLPLPPADETRTAQVVATLRRAMGGAAFDQAWTGGLTLLLEEAVTEAAALTFGATADSVAAPPVMPLGGRSPLTPRELDVLRLIVEGQSSRAIAEVLFLSPRTVTTHTSSIFSKLDVASRSAAAAYAVRHSLV